MKKRIQFLLAVVLCVIVSMNMQGQEYRSLSGAGNNQLQPQLGSVEGPVLRLTDASFGDGISEPGAAERANSRVISNEIFDQSASIVEQGRHSDYVWVFGQFIDHDITLIKGDPNEPMVITVPPCDPNFDPNCTGQSIIPMNRATQRFGSGTDQNNPREYSNSITSFIDASNVYGSDPIRAAYLRSFVGGKLRISKDELLPFNTTDGEFNSGKDFSAPEMDMENPTVTKWFVAGDVRANENLLLTSMHTIFVREHNRWCTSLASLHSEWSDETLYQEAKMRTTAVIQAIVYEEWLPTMGVRLPAYSGYLNTVDPSILKSFSAAAFRLGHTMLNSNIKRMDGNCQDHPNGDISLLDAFFNPSIVLLDGGINPLLRGMAAQNIQEIDGKMVDDVRNFLFGAPGSGIGMDLAAINIQRGREMGLPDFNSIRKTFGLPPFDTIEEICLEKDVTDKMTELYASVDNIDPWVGMLCEEHMDDDIMFGRTIVEILKYQFAALRDGDRFFYENETLLDADEIVQIKKTRLADVIKRNTTLRFMQDNVFLTEEDCEHANITLQEVMLDVVAYPNPASSSVLLKIGVYSVLDVDVEINMVDQLGRTVQINRDVLLEGMNILQLDISTLHPGNYILHLSAGAARTYRQVVVL